MKHDGDKRRRRQGSRKRRAKRKLPQQLKAVNLNAAGIDIGSEEHYVAVPEGRDEEEQNIRRFGAFTTDLHQIVNWLKQCGVETVAMESTGVYWIPLYELLEQEGFEVKLVDAKKVKNVPGRKSDVSDCRWLQTLHTYGLLEGAFRPEDGICVLRSYMRQRGMLVKMAAQHIQHMQKALIQMNLKLHNVIRDITGLTGMKILRSIVEGERDPAKLSRFRHPRCKNSAATIRKSLQGNYRREHVFALKQALELYDFYQHELDECDEQIQEWLGTFEDRRPEGAELASCRKGSGGNAPAFDVRGYLHRMTGVDLTAIDGVQAHTALKLVSETGLDMSRWKTVGNFTSWLGLCPNKQITGGKVLRTKTKTCANRAATSFRMAAQALHRSNSALGAFLRRKKSHLGAPQAITATAHKIARIYYFMLKHGTDYVDRGQDYYEKEYQKRIMRNLRRRAQKMGYKLIAVNQLGEPLSVNVS